jgi:hypothetical protein
VYCGTSVLPSAMLQAPTLFTNNYVYAQVCIFLNAYMNIVCAHISPSGVE